MMTSDDDFWAGVKARYDAINQSWENSDLYKLIGLTDRHSLLDQLNPKRSAMRNGGIVKLVAGVVAHFAIASSEKDECAWACVEYK